MNPNWEKECPGWNRNSKNHNFRSQVTIKKDRFIEEQMKVWPASLMDGLPDESQRDFAV
jgi:hypothetical protein